MIDAIVKGIQGLLAKPEVTEHPTETGVKILATPPGWSTQRIADDVRLQRKHTFTCLRTFEDWVIKLAGGKEPTVEILLDDSTDAGTLDATLDASNRYADTLSCKLTFTSEYVQVKKALGLKLVHRDFYLLLSNLRDYLEQAEMLLTAAKTLSVNIEAGVSATMERGHYVVKNDSNKTEVCSEIPSALAFEVPIYRGLLETGDDVAPDSTELRRYTLPMLLLIDTKDPKVPTFQLTCPRHDDILAEARVDIVAQVNADLTEGNVPHLIGFGKLDVAQVAVGNGPQKYDVNIRQ